MSNLQKANNIYVEGIGLPWKRFTCPHGHTTVCTEGCGAIIG